MQNLWLIILSLGLIGGPSVVAAQITMEAQLGLQGIVRLEKWNLVTVTLANNGTPVRGTLGVRIWRGSEYRKDVHVTTFTRAVQLPYRARKRFRFTVPLYSITHPVDIVFRSGDTLLAQQRLDLRSVLSAEHIIVGLTPDLSLDFLATTFQRHTRVAYVPVRDVPHVWSGYDSVTAIVVKGVSLQTLTEEQWTALRQWVMRGGILVIAGDAQYGLLQEPRLRELLPVQVLGIVRRDGLPVLAAHYNVPLPSAPLIVLRARLQQGEVLVGTPEAPLLAQRRLGEGRVVFLAVDYAAKPLDTWPGNGALWRDILQPAETVDFARVFSELGLLDDSHPIIKLLGRPILAYPSHVSLSVFLCAYCGSIAAVFWGMKRRRLRQARPWAILGLLLVGFGIGAYTLFPERGLRQTALLLDASILELFPQTDSARAQGYLGVFSARGGTFTLSMQEPSTILRHTFHRGAGKAGSALEIRAGEELALRDITLEPWTLRVFSVESMFTAPLQIAAQLHETGLTVRVRNQATVPFHGAVVLYKGRLFALGTVAPQEELFEDLFTTLQPSESKYETAWQAVLKLRTTGETSRVAYLQEVLLQQYFGERHLTEMSEVPLLLGWQMTPTILRTSPGTLPVRGMTLVVSHLSNRTE
jgi:hypothetical protein